MESFTAMSAEALVATLNNLPSPYELRLNYDDMSRLLSYLWVTYNNGLVMPSQREWVEQFMSSVSETVGVEHV